MSIFAQLMIVGVVMALGVSVLNRYIHSHRNIGYGFGKQYWEKLNQSYDDRLR